MVNFPILSLLTFLPLVGAFFILTIRGDNQEIINRNAKLAALYCSAFTFALSIFMVVNFDAANTDFQFVEQVEWLPAPPKTHLPSPSLPRE